jgi:hypothetical protein
MSASLSSQIFGTVFKLGYQISPIILTGGIATDLGGVLPIAVLTEGVSALVGLIGGNFPTSLDDFFAQFIVMPGGTLIEQDLGRYPFANQATAANAVITDPLTVSIRMDCPANNNGGYVSKLATLTALQAALSAHNAAGGLYTVATPGFIYPNLLMRKLTDISGSGSKQVQYQWQFDFEQPLVTLQAAQQVYSSLINKIAGGTQISGIPSWSSISNSVTGGLSSITSGLSSLTGSVTSGIGSAASSIAGAL